MHLCARHSSLLLKSRSRPRSGWTYGGYAINCTTEMLLASLYAGLEEISNLHPGPGRVGKQLDL